MQRYLTLALAVAAAVGSLNAGPIQTQIGLVNGLTGSTIGSSNLGGWSERNYDNKLFAGTVGMSATPYTGYSSTASVAGTLTDSSAAADAQDSGGVTFSMINDGCGGTSGGACTMGALSNNVWEAASGAASTITIPVGIFNVTDAWTMLNNQWGQSGLNDTTVTFNFTSGPTGPESLIVNLTNSTNSGGTGQVRDAADCTAATTGPPSCTSYATGGIAGTLVATSGTAASLLPSVTVDLNTLYTASFNAMPTAGGPYQGATTGSVNLDDQGFIFGNAFNGFELVSIQITENNGGTKTSGTALSAITVDSLPSLPTPEPSSMLLGLSGLVGLGVVALRRRRVV